MRRCAARGTPHCRLTRTLEAQKRRNCRGLCDFECRGETVTTDTPSFLCPVAMCWAFEVGTCDGLYSGSAPRADIHCDCMRNVWMGFYDDEEESRVPSHRIPWWQQTEGLDWRTDRIRTEGILWRRDDPPGGWCGPGFDAVAAAAKLTSEDVRLECSDDYPGLERMPSFGKV